VDTAIIPPIPQRMENVLASFAAPWSSLVPSKHLFGAADKKPLSPQATNYSVGFLVAVLNPQLEPKYTFFGPPLWSSGQSS
jgi:hypothetical protein